MSELEEKIIGAGINKKQVVAIAIVTGLLISLFAFSVFFTSSIFGSQRPLPSENLENSEEEDAELIMPPYPFDLESLMELFENMSLEQQEQLAESLAEMMDGNIDDLDLLKYGALVGALLFSNVEKFSVYDYDQWDSENLSKILWKYETFDRYNGTAWQTSATKSDYSFYSYDNYTSQHSNADIMQLKMPLAPEVGTNSFVIPSLFPTPFIMEDSLNVNNVNPSSIRLFKDDFNSTTLDLEFYSDSEINMYYELFGLPLPSNEEVNNSAVGEEYTPTSIQNQFLQLPPTIEGYIDSHPYFESHYNELETIIEDGDNAFQIANKIRNYLQTNFELGMDARNEDPPEEGEDIVEWFCEHEEGIYTEFASAFCAFTRAFGVASRFVDGFNSRNIQEEYDDTEGKNSFVIRYRNIYNWAEIFVPTETTGEGSWVQIDILFETFGAGGQVVDPPETPSSYSLDIETESEVYNRGEQANITATLSSDTDPIDDQTITFIDPETEETIGEVLTDYRGKASLFLDLDETFGVGPHYVAAQYQSEYNATYFVLDGNVSVHLNEPVPSEMNKSETDTTTLSGYVYDPDTGFNVSNAGINLVFFDKSPRTRIDWALNPSLTYTDSNGTFSETVQVDSLIDVGEYEIRADFNGTWTTLTNTYPYINASSNYQDFNITEELTYYLHFYINDYSADYYENPAVSRGQNLTLKAKLITEDGDPVGGKDITFYDDSLGTPIQSVSTNDSGIALFNYTMDPSNIAGPNLISVRYGALFNKSYYILDEPIGLNLNTWPTNREISRSGTTDRTFSVSGTLNDLNTNDPIKNGELTIHMYTLLGSEVFYLNQESGSLQTDNSGYFSASFRVDPATPLQNYTLQMHFNGTFDYTSTSEPYYFELNSFINFSDASLGDYELKVTDLTEISIELSVNNNPTREFYDDINPPEVIKNGETITFQVQVYQSGSPAPDGTVVKLYDYFYDSLNPLKSYTYKNDDNGYYEFEINETVKNDWHPGLHRIVVKWEDYDNYNDTYFIVNESINVGIDNSINSNSYVRGVENFDISGSILNGSQGLEFLNVSIRVFNSTGHNAFSEFDISSRYDITESNGEYSFNIAPLPTCPNGTYRFRVDFNGSINAAPDVILNDDIYMPHNSSLFVEVNVNASTDIIADSYWTTYEYLDPDKWINKDTLFVNGTLLWDNDDPLVGMNVTLAVYRKGEDVPFASNSSVQTDLSGFFEISLKIDETWPTYRDDTIIKVIFDPYIQENILEYTEGSEEIYN